MKTRVLKAVILYSLLIIGVISCNDRQGENNSKHIQDSIRRADSNRSAIDTSSTKYREDERKALNEYNVRIAELKRDYEKGKRDVNKEYDKDIDKLQQESADLDARLNEFKYKSEDDWRAFKRGFDNDMDSLGKSISRVAEKDKQKSQ